MSYAPALLAANKVVVDSEALRQDFGRRTERNACYIGYQAPDPRIVPLTQATRDRLRLTRPYVLVIARLEPENNVGLVIEALRRCDDLEIDGIIVGSTTTAHYRDVLAAAASARIRFLGGIYDRETLDELRGGCVAYAHGHTVGGTNPSLLEALARAGGTVLCHANKYNRETAAGAAQYYSTIEELVTLLREAITHPVRRIPVRDDRFLPEHVAAKYLEVFRTVARSV
jgi:glycosyltransferase involved in cell wall biosynthesis